MPKELEPEVQAAFDALSDRLVGVQGALEDMQANQPEALQKAFVGAFQQIIQNDQLMEAAATKFFSSANAMITKQAGEWTMDQIKALPKRLFWIVLGFLAIWQTGGLAAAIKFLGAVWASISVQKE